MSAEVTLSQRDTDVWLAEIELAEASERWTEARAGADRKALATADRELNQALNVCRRARRRLDDTLRRLEKRRTPPGLAGPRQTERR